MVLKILTRVCDRHRYGSKGALKHPIAPLVSVFVASLTEFVVLIWLVHQSLLV